MPRRKQELDEFVRSENIRRFEKKLAAEADPKARELLTKLLAEARSEQLAGPKSQDRKAQS